MPTTSVTYIDSPTANGIYYYRAVITDESDVYVTNASHNSVGNADYTIYVSLIGDETITLTVGDMWTDPGAIIVHIPEPPTSDTPHTNYATASGTVDTTTPGTYVITYTGTSLMGIVTPATRTVIVQAATSTPDTDPDPDQDTAPDPPLPSHTRIITHTTLINQIPFNQQVWLRAVINDTIAGGGTSSTPTNTANYRLQQSTSIRAVHDNNVLCLSRSGMSLSSGRENYFLARLETGSGTTARALRLDEIASITYTIRRHGYTTSEPTNTVVGHVSVPVLSSESVWQNPVTDSCWTVDTTGYNFSHWPDTSENFPFPTAGFYEVEYIFTATNGQRTMLVFHVNVN